MSVATFITSHEAVPERQRLALIKLLGDEDPAVHETVREKIIACGETACHWLRPHTLSDDPLVRRQAQGIIRHFEKVRADNQFLGFCLQHGEDLDLEQGAWLLARTQFPEINVEAYRAVLDGFADELRERVSTANRSSSLLLRVNEHLFRRLRFHGNSENYYDPDNSYLNRVLDRRTGNPIALCLFYLLVARRLHLPIVGIGLPGHFLCRYQTLSDEIYVDAFNRGKLMTKADCIHYLVRGNYDLRDEYLAPVSPRRLLTRICGNLHQIYLRAERNEEVTRFQRYLVALAR